ncbi:RDD family protein [Massilia sp. TSP1-1-2]|uniref:RDD family protein n=1 Tax=unclassified Massilia TaxID=2609279 RepID=UPI003CF58B79
MQNSTSLVATPSIKRRLICLVYEAFLVVAVLALAMTVFLMAVKGYTGPFVEHGPKFVIFLGAGAYFIHSWSGSGFTLAMKTWRIKVVHIGTARVPFRNAAVRYVFSWGWMLPGGLIYQALGYHDRAWAAMSLSMLAGICIWAATAFLDKDRQFLHDKLARTRLICLPKPVKASKAPANTTT